jgi:hypothetical protein
MSLPPPWHFRFAHNNDAGSGSYIGDQNAKDLIRIDENLVRQEITKERRAELVAKKVQLEGIVRKGKFNHGKELNHGESLTTGTVIKGQGVKSPAIQLGEQLGRKQDYMRSRFKEWAFQTGYKGPMSSVEGDDLKSLAQFCADFEAAKKKKGSNKEAKAQVARCLPPTPLLPENIRTDFIGAPP